MQSETKKCPYCGSDIPVNVKKCKHCGEWLAIQEKDKPKASLHLGIIIEILIGILSIPIGLHISADWAICFIIVAYIGLNLYFLPTLIADGKRTQYTLAIFALNLLLGLTVIGWIVALIWALALPNLSKNIEDTDNSQVQAKNISNRFQEISTQKINTLDESSETKRCPYCAELIPKNATYCNICDSHLNENSFPNKIISAVHNSSSDETPDNIKQWNWGAFWFSWIWGIANKSYMTLLVLIPFVGLIWMFICGAKGNEWAWKNKNWASIEDFNEAQKKWAIAGNCLAGFLIIFILLILLLFSMPQQDVEVPVNNEQTTVQQTNSNSDIEEKGDIIEQANEYAEERGDIIDMAEDDYNHSVNENQQQKQINNPAQPKTQPIVQPIKQQETTTQNNVVVPQSKQNNQDIDDFMN